MGYLIDLKGWQGLKGKVATTWAIRAGAKPYRAGAHYRESAIKAAICGPSKSTPKTPQAQATAACNGFANLTAHLPGYLHNQVRAVARVGAWWKDAMNASSDPNYQKLSDDFEKLATLAASSSWRTKANPTMSQFTNLGDDCYRLSKAGLVD